MTLIIAMMIDLLNGLKTIKNERLKSFNKRRVLAYCLAPIKVLGLVNGSIRKKKETEKLWA